jgi:hypothetical protein
MSVLPDIVKNVIADSPDLGTEIISPQLAEEMEPDDSD